MADDVRAKVKGLEQYIGRVEQLATERRLPAIDVRRAYAGAFLAHYTVVEDALERLFVGALLGRLVFSRRLEPLVDVRSDATARAIVRAGQRYIDWLPYHLTRSRGEAFFSNSTPFPEVVGSDNDALDKIRMLRNAIAHESSDSLRTFRRHFVAGISLPRDQHTPSGYLRGWHSVGQTRFVFWVNESVRILQRLCR